MLWHRRIRGRIRARLGNSYSRGRSLTHLCCGGCLRVVEWRIWLVRIAGWSRLLMCLRHEIGAGPPNMLWVAGVLSVSRRRTRHARWERRGTSIELRHLSVVHWRRSMWSAVPYMLEAGVVDHLRVHHASIWLRCPSMLVPAQVVCSVFIVVVITTTVLVRKVLRALVLVCAAILLSISISSLSSDRADKCAYVLEPGDDLVDVGRRVLV